MTSQLGEHIWISIFFAELVALTYYDIRYGILPDDWTIPGTIAGLTFALFEIGPVSLEGSVAGMLVGGVGFWLLHAFWPDKMGFGDVKMAAMLGAAFGIQHLHEIILIATVTGVVVTYMLRRKLVPFGPFLALGAAWTEFGFRDLYGPYLGVGTLCAKLGM
ncbi:MAG: A24 family peptidase [Pseudomonadota bacterium]